jgi:hypothetical protein
MGALDIKSFPDLQKSVLSCWTVQRTVNEKQLVILQRTATTAQGVQTARRYERQQQQAASPKVVRWPDPMLVYCT